MTEFWIALGAVMAGLGSAAIAVQAWLTRGLVKATQDDLKTGRQVVLEAAKNRLDARGPMLVIGTVATSQVPLVGSPYGDPQPFQGELSMPRDQALPILVQVDIEVVNNGSGTVHITTPAGMLAVPGAASEVSYQNRPRLKTTQTVGPGTFRYFRWWAEMPFETWLVNCEAAVSGAALTHEPFCEVMVSDALDEGVLDRWKISATGAPFYADKATAGRWHVVLGSTNGETFTSRAIHIERLYYRSRNRNVALEDALQAS